MVALTGDGGLLMCAGELLTAAREKLRIITIVFSDASLSLIEIKQQARRLEPAGVALGAIDWPALASSFGVRAWVATTEAETSLSFQMDTGTEGIVMLFELALTDTGLKGTITISQNGEKVSGPVELTPVK